MVLWPALILFGCGQESPPAPLPPIAEGWTRHSVARAFTVDVPDSMKDEPLLHIDVMPSDPPIERDGRLVGAGCYLGWDVTAWDRFKKSYRLYHFPLSKNDLREVRKRPCYWTVLQDGSQEMGLRRFTSTEHLVFASVLVANSRWAVHVWVADHVPGDSTTVKQILGSVRLVPNER